MSAQTDRLRRNGVLFVRFGIVGATGVVVNMLTLIAVKRLGPHFDDAVFPLGIGDFHLRWYHVFSTVAFFVANLWNFQLNRSWTFKSSKHARWIAEYWPFLVVGLLGQVLGLVLLTLLMHPSSPIALPGDVFDDSSGLRSRLYWAQLIVIGVVTPLSFVLNKLWTFAAVRSARMAADPLHVEEALHSVDDHGR